MIEPAVPDGPPAADGGLWRRTARAWRRHGPIRFVYLVFFNLFHAARRLVWRNPIERTNAAFDRKYGTDTAGGCGAGNIDIDSSSVALAIEYQTTKGDYFQSLMDRLEIDHSRHTFIDFGSGKGKMLLLASAYPFREILGVELSSALHRIAEKNLAIYRDPGQRCTKLRAICADALAFEPPPGPLVCFLYNPFQAAILRGVLENLERSLGREPRDMLVVYMHPLHRELLDRSKRWELLDEGPDHSIYRALPAGN